MAIFPNMVGHIWRGRVTIPNNTGTGANLLALLRAAGYPGPDACAVKLAAKLADATTARGAFVAAQPREGAAIQATDFTTHGEPIAEGVEYAEPCDRDAILTSVRAAASDPVLAQATVVW